MNSRLCAFALSLAFLAGCATTGPLAPTASPDVWPLAVRVHSYGKYQDIAYAHLQEIGVHYIFISVPAPEEADATLAELKKYGLTPLVMRGSADLSLASFAQELAPQLATCEKMGVHYLFLSAKRGEASKDLAFARLREAGDVAAKHGVIIALETHPDLGTNGDVQRQTMRATDHRNVRVNFDTANITYYNHDTTAAAELAKSIGYVGTVEFKDHNGEFETWDFPVLGQGVVDFPQIVEMLKKHGYSGPVTLEFEGTKGVELTEEQTKQAIAACVAQARALANFD